MTDRTVYERTVHLDNIRQLFSRSQASPLDQTTEEFGANSPIEYIVADLFDHPQAERLKLNVFLPQGQIAPDLQSTTTQAIERYLTAQARNSNHEIAKNAYLGSRSFLTTLTVFLIANGLGLLLNRANSILISTFGDAFIALGWVVLMWSGWTWILGQWENQVKSQAYVRLESIELSIKPDPRQPRTDEPSL